MALKGTLLDLGIVDLIQFPRAGRKTGELVVEARDHEAHMYYREGDVVHAQMDGVEGIDALVSIVDLTEGDFEFRADVPAPKKTIDVELHRAVMTALKIRDERKLEEARRRAQEEEARRRRESEVMATQGDESKIGGKLAEFVLATPFATHACVLGFNGDVVAQASRKNASMEGFEELCLAVHSLRQAHPRPGLSRVVIEDELGLVLLAKLGGGSALVLVATRQAPMGAVLVALGKLTQEVER